MAQKVQYWDNEAQKTKEGYNVGGKLFIDAAGTVMPSAGSHFNDNITGQRYVMHDGTQADRQAYWEEARKHVGNNLLAGYADLSRQTVYDSGGNITGYVPNKALEGGGFSSGGYAESYINSIYDAKAAASEAALRNAYEQNVNALNAARPKLEQQYQVARNDAAAQSDIARANLNEAAAASGLNTGAGSQIALSLRSALQGSLSSLGRAEADALADLELRLTQLETNYRNSAAQAIAEGDLARAQSLYDDFRRERDHAIQQAQADAQMQYDYDALAQRLRYDYNALAQKQSQFDASMEYDKDKSDYQRMVYTAELLAQAGDFSGYKALGFTDEQIAGLRAWYQAQIT